MTYGKNKTLLLGFLLSCAVMCLSSCVSNETSQNLVLKGTVSEESPTLDPSFLARRLKAEKSFFGFSTSPEDPLLLPDDEDEEESAIPDTQHSFDLRQNQEATSAGTSRFIWPANGQLSSLFGPRTLRRVRRMHAGVDIGAASGTPIHAAASGQVLFSGRKRGYGKAVILAHNKTIETLYAHMSKILVREGQHITRNQLIGYVGRTGRATGSNLHFETRINGIAYNPLPYLPPARGGKMRKGMMIPSYADQMDYYSRLDRTVYQKTPRKKRTPQS